MNIYQIVKTALPANESTDIGFVYFLINDGEIVYVGQTIHLMPRIASHKRDKDFDSYNFIECKASELDLIESFYIHVLSPRLNGKLQSGASVLNFKSEEKSAPIGIVKILDLIKSVGCKVED